MNIASLICLHSRICFGQLTLIRNDRVSVNVCANEINASRLQIKLFVISVISAVGDINIERLLAITLQNLRQDYTFLRFYTNEKNKPHKTNECEQKNWSPLGLAGPRERAGTKSTAVILSSLQSTIMKQRDRFVVKGQNQAPLQSVTHPNEAGDIRLLISPPLSCPASLFWAKQWPVPPSLPPPCPAPIMSCDWCPCCHVERRSSKKPAGC